METVNEEILNNENNSEKDNVEVLLNSVSDEYLAKRKRIRIISYSIISFVIFALSLIIIVMSSVKVDLRPSFIGKGASSYKIVINNSSNPININQYIDEKKYNEFTDLYLKSFQSQYLTALFTGRLKGYNIIEEPQNYFYSDTQNSNGISSTLKKYLGENYVGLHYDEPKQILNSNGSVYYSLINSNTTLTFNDVYFNLNTSDAENELVFYLGAFGYLSRGEARIVKISVRANTYDLYKYIAG